MAIIKNNQQGQLYKAIICGITDIVVSQIGFIDITIQVYIFSPGREHDSNTLKIVMPDNISSGSEIKDFIYDEILNLCDRNGWPLQRTDIVSL